MVEIRMRTALLANTALAALIGTRLSEGHKPQGSAYPCVTFRRASTGTDYSHSGRSSLGYCRIMFHCWAKSPVDARNVAAAIVAALSTFDLTLPAASPETVTKLSPNKVLNQVPDEWPDPEPTIYRELLDVKLCFQE